MKTFNYEEARDDLRRLNNPTYGGGINICYGDGYYANSLIRKWGIGIEELQRKVDAATPQPKSHVRQLVARVRKLSKADREAFDELLAKPRKSNGTKDRSSGTTASRDA